MAAAAGAFASLRDRGGVELLKSHPRQRSAPDAVPGRTPAGEAGCARAVHKGRLALATPGPGLAPAAAPNLAAGGQTRSLHVAPYLAAPGTDLPGGGGGSSMAAAAAEPSAATSLMHAPRPAWRRIAVRGPAWLAAAPGVQRGAGAGAGQSLPSCRNAAARSRPRGRHLENSLGGQRSREHRYGARGGTGRAGGARCAAAGRAGRQGAARGVGSPAAGAAAPRAGGGEGARCGTAAVPSRDAGCVSLRSCGKGRVCAGTGR